MEKQCSTCKYDLMAWNGSDEEKIEHCNMCKTPEYEGWATRVEDRNPQKYQSDESTAVSLLTKAASIMEERGKQYDQEGGERSMGKCVAAFNTITGQNLSEAEGWLLLQVLKDVRQWLRKGYHADSAEDCIAYAALKAEAKSKEIDNEKN